jgi:hypothetical protein
MTEEQNMRHLTDGVDLKAFCVKGQLRISPSGVRRGPRFAFFFYTPEQNGRAQRFNRTLTQKCIVTAGCVCFGQTELVDSCK